MSTVTQRVTEIKQPYGGYLQIKSFTKEFFNDGKSLNVVENIHPSLVGIAVDYLTRFTLGDSVDKAFQISYLGASNIGMQSIADFLKSKVTGLDNVSIASACKLAGFDVCYRASISAYKPIENINPDTATIENIRTMVTRSVSFWKKYGPIVCSEPTFEGGYTNTVDSGDGDFLSNDTLWDFKVSKSAPTSKHSLQILMYYVMGLHSIHHAQYKNVSNLGIFNPRLNVAYICPINSISKETIAIIENEVLCYSVNKSTFQEKNLQNKTHSNQTNELSVADICSMTGIKKSALYADIHKGVLISYKKGNKYFVSQDDFVDYYKRIKMRQKIQIGVAILFIILAIIIMLSMLNH